MKDTEYKLYNITKLNKWNKYTSMFRNKSLIKEVLPDHYLDEYQFDLEEAESELNELDNKLNYLNTLRKNQNIFKNLHVAKINGLAYKVFKELEKNETILSGLERFRPSKGYCAAIEYNQTNTVTGRLTTTKYSPNILTLPARCRKIFESRWQQEGDLLYIDFKTLEPRVIRKINGKEASDDIYLEIAGMLDFEVDRIIIKRGIISTLYGATSTISGLSQERSNAVLEATKNYFDLSSISKKASYVHDVGCRINFFGRPIWNIEEEQGNKIVNNFVQSTAVDVALSYFSELCDLVDLEKCKPIFIIHDALVLDVHKSYIETCKKIVQTGYTCPQLGHFPIDICKLSETF